MQEQEVGQQKVASRGNSRGRCFGVAQEDQHGEDEERWIEASEAIEEEPCQIEEGAFVNRAGFAGGSNS